MIKLRKFIAAWVFGLSLVIGGIRNLAIAIIPQGGYACIRFSNEVSVSVPRPTVGFVLDVQTGARTKISLPQSGLILHTTAQSLDGQDLLSIYTDQTVLTGWLYVTVPGYIAPLLLDTTDFPDQEYPRWSSTGKLFYTVTHDKQVISRIFDALTLQTLTLTQAAHHDVQWSPNGHYLAFNDLDPVLGDSIQIWSVDDLRLLQTIPNADFFYPGYEWSPDEHNFLYLHKESSDKYTLSLTPVSLTPSADNQQVAMPFSMKYPFETALEQLQWFEDAHYFGFLDSKNHAYHIFKTDGTPIIFATPQFFDVESTDDPNVLLGVRSDGNTQDLVRLNITGDHVTEQILTTSMIKRPGPSFDRLGNAVAFVTLKFDYASMGVDIIDIDTGHRISLSIDTPRVISFQWVGDYLEVVYEQNTGVQAVQQSWFNADGSLVRTVLAANNGVRLEVWATLFDSTHAILFPQSTGTMLSPEPLFYYLFDIKSGDIHQLSETSDGVNPLELLRSPDQTQSAFRLGQTVYILNADSSVIRRFTNIGQDYNSMAWVSCY